MADTRPLVTHVITGLGVGGAETMLHKLIGASRDFRHNVVSLTAMGEIGPQIAALGSDVVALDLSRPTRWISAAGRLRTLFRDQQPDLIQGWLNHGNLLALAFSGLARSDPPVLWNVRQSLLGMRFEKWHTRRVIRLSARLSHRTAAILYNSASGARDHEEIGYDSSKTVLVPNGFDLDRFRPDAADRAGVRRELGIAPDEVAVGLIARFDKWKNHGAFFEAASRLLDSAPACRFVLVGSGMDADNDELGALIGDPRVRERSLFLGCRDDMPAVNAALDISCNVSHGEGFPNAIGEAMAAAVPCMVVAHGDMPDIVGETGAIAATADPEAIAVALLSLVNLGHKGRVELGVAARARADARFSLPAVAARYESIYDEILSRSECKSRA
jgi:glycosyltransferase involved in cell wall biosynthesis